MPELWIWFGLLQENTLKATLFSAYLMDCDRHFRPAMIEFLFIQAKVICWRRGWLLEIARLPGLLEVLSVVPLHQPRIRRRHARRRVRQRNLRKVPESQGPGESRCNGSQQSKRVIRFFGWQKTGRSMKISMNSGFITIEDPKNPAAIKVFFEACTPQK